MDNIRNTKSHGKSRLQWHARYHDDFEGDTGHLTDPEYRAYSRLVDQYYRQGSLPSDDEHLALIVRKSVADWEAIKPAVKAMFYDGWRDPDIEERRAEAQEKHAKRVAAGRRGGRPSGDRKPRNDKSNAYSNAYSNAERCTKPTTTTTTSTLEGRALCKEDLYPKGLANSLEGSATVQEGASTRGRRANGHGGSWTGEAE